MAVFTGTNADETILPNQVSPTVTTSGAPFPGADADILNGGGGADILGGGDNNDTLTGGSGDDQMFGQAGNDRMIWNPGDGTDLMEGGDGVDTAEVNGGNGAETFSITANGTRVRFDGLAPSVFSLDIGTSESLVLNANGGDDTITASNGLATLIQLTIDGGTGNDTIGGGDGADMLLGGDGNDTVDGNRGNDVALLGIGDDIFTWDPGDGSDVVEGQAGFDTLGFNGANVSEQIGISANGGRLRFTRDVAAITMDLNDVEHVRFNALGGSDTITVNDLSGTDAIQIEVDLASTLGGVLGDGQVDTIIVNGTNGADTVMVTGSASSVTASGLAATVSVLTAEASDIVRINGLGGDDTIDGSAAAHALILDGGDNNDTLTGGSGNDQMFGQAGNDRMIWNPGDGTDLMEGADGVDTAEVNGGNGAETFSITANGTRVRFDGLAPSAFSLDIGTTESLVLNANGGDDTITASNGLAALIQLTIDGGAGNDTIGGGDGADMLLGGDGNDIVDGNRGNDVTLLGIGDDLFTWDPGDGSDVVEGQAGFDTLGFNGANVSEQIGISANGGRLRFTRDVAAITMDLNDVEHIRFNALGGSDTITVNDLSGTDAAQVEVDLASTLGGITGDGQVDTVIVNGTNGADAVMVTGSASSVTASGLASSVAVITAEASDIVRINGLGGNDTIDGSAAAHALILDGGDNNDTLTGGSGNDTLIGGLGDDTIAFAGELQPVTVNLSAVVDQAVGAGTGTDQLTGVENATGGSGADTLTGDALANRLTGGGGNDRLDGKGGADTLAGGAGNDIYYIDDAADAVIEGAGQGTLDWVATSVSYALATGVQVEKLSTTASGGVAAINLTGNEFAQAITGNAGANRLDGKAGADTMTGLGGNDTYYVDNAGDKVVEGAGQGTADWVAASVSYALAAGVQVEKLSTTISGGAAAINLTGNEFAQTIVGNAGNNRLDGKGSADTMTGLGGNDTYYVDNTGDTIFEGAGQGTLDWIATSVSYALAAGAEIEKFSTTVSSGTAAIDLTGNEFVQVMTGNAGNNRLDGKGGADTMSGLAGNDTYIVDNVADRVAEGAGQGALDWVAASVSYALAAGVQVEILSTTSRSGLAAINLTGNEFVQTITGNAGDNRLDGRVGADTMNGLASNDIYYVDNAGDRVVEGANGGTADWVATGVSYILAAGVQVEKFSTTNAAGNTAISLMGNEFGQIIGGNAGANIISGKAGNDTLTGAGGADIFVFDTALNSTANVDRITDYSTAADTIWLQNSIFTQIVGTGVLTAAQFAANATGAAADANDRIIYETDTGKLFYDQNGDGAGGSFHFATLAAGLALTNADFVVI